jgi:hypothetical protein
MIQFLKNRNRILLVLFLIYVFIISGGLPSAEAADSNVTFTVE